MSTLIMMIDYYLFIYLFFFEFWAMALASISRMDDFKFEIEKQLAM